MDFRHDDEDREGGGTQKSVCRSGQEGEAKDPGPPEKDREGSGVEVLPVTERPRHDSPFLRDKWGWTDSDACWWCDGGRQSRDHLFKECKRWEKEIRELWNAVGRVSGKRQEGDGPFRSRKGFGFHVRQARARPSNTTVRELLSNSRYTEAVLDFLGKTRVGKVKEGVTCK